MHKIKLLAKLTGQPQAGDAKELFMAVSRLRKTSTRAETFDDNTHTVNLLYNPHYLSDDDKRKLATELEQDFFESASIDVELAFSRARFNRDTKNGNAMKNRPLGFQLTRVKPTDSAQPLP